MPCLHVFGIAFPVPAIHYAEHANRHLQRQTILVRQGSCRLRDGEQADAVRVVQQCETKMAGIKIGRAQTAIPEIRAQRLSIPNRRIQTVGGQQSAKGQLNALPLDRVQCGLARYVEIAF